ncbi:MAG: glutamine--fructose-6-phosphate transaminase (isomerizing) [Candidatus Buchananbacteria bacterium CG10_big_fil_rev_8_21_14_0_10_42_9]|uniref:Glutamine--fructose-6-phosphate aminotransferase [isomerizing] n=1 Tax=Candidatus Buchananbacteria bacterium CG10_big_fil_rev_8_21_14_0_10_42_9 TaxID=1974526 RepID=A0A2H0W1C8_9BACT|nr:MAG: glutamine--fructose-6-phosphate transaminase (isomerizing) [Candidatus Buchananbacteria bacterium CG10_big_fil_rev_8_21_14_0_10_42_9]
MCGIIGYIGKQQALPILLEGLRRMEYRGYDSAGVALCYQGKLEIIKKQGKLNNLSEQLKSRSLTSNFGIGHIRWATHGEPSDINAHPHADCQNNVVLVHNGIIENYQELKRWLLSQKHKLNTQTDSEVLAHLIEEHQKNVPLEAAVRSALHQVRGAYGLAIISRSEPDKIVAARLGSPVVIGIISASEYLVASDVTAVLPFTREVVFLEEAEMAVITRQGYSISKLNGDEANHLPQQIEWDPVEAEKGGFDHFMLKEIMEEPEVVRSSMRGRVILEEGQVKLGGLIDVMDELKNLERLYIVACGTAHYAGRIGSYLIENLAGIPTEVEYASEFRYREKPLDAKSVVLAISQSGETADTLAAVRLANKQNLLTIGIVNAVGSSIARETKAGVYNHVGPEIAVASTKVFVSQLVILVLLAILLGRQRQLPRTKAQEIIKELLSLPDKIQQVLEQKEKIKEIAKIYQSASNFIFIGRKLNYPVALEGALKMKEISYVHAEGYPAGELKHGPLALIDKNWPVVAIIPKDSVYEKTLSNLEEVRARHGQIIALATAGDKEISKIAQQVIYLPETLEILYPILSVVPLQLLAYYLAQIKGCDIDQPRNLAKSVTVE